MKGEINTERSKNEFHHCWIEKCKIRHRGKRVKKEGKGMRGERLLKLGKGRRELF